MAVGRRVVDTSAWIEWFANSPLVSALRPHFPDNSAAWCPRSSSSNCRSGSFGRAARPRLIASWLMPANALSFRSTRIALLAADARREFKLATADAVIYATSRHQGADLLTCDAHFRDLPGVVLVEKTAGMGS